MVGFQDEEVSLSHLNPLIIAIPLQESLRDEPPGTCGNPAKQRQKRAKWGCKIHNLPYIIYFWIYTRVLMASEQVPVASRLVGVASKVVPVASRQVPIGYEPRLKP